MKNGRGFTLIELLITGVILAVLTGLALPSFRGSLEAGRLSEAKTNLQIIYTGQKVYALNHSGKYYPDAGCTADTIYDYAAVNTALGVDTSTRYYGTDFYFTVDNGTSTFTVKAKRNTNSGGSTSTFYTIDQAGAIKDKNSNAVPL